MEEHRRSLNVATLSWLTLLSRLLGLLRDILFFALLGAGGAASAFITAFTLPNLFRRLFGEGALAAAFIPSFVRANKSGEGEREGFRLLNQTASRLLLGLVGVTIAGWALLLGISLFPGLPDRYYQMSHYALVLLPYSGLVCLAALLGATLQAMHRFLSSGLSQIWLNISLILALLVLSLWPAFPLGGAMYWLCAAVLLGGVFQVLFPGISLARLGWKPSWDWQQSVELRQLKAMFWPSLAGAAVFQINFAVSRLLALGVSDEAASLLYLANRILELPLGIFVIAVATVTFPSLSRLSIEKDEAGLVRTFRQSALQILAIALPAAVGMALLREPIVEVLFSWGAFSEKDATGLSDLLLICALSLPFYSLATLTTRAFYAQTNTRLPLRLACLNLGLNTILSLALMQPFGMFGLAWANTLSALLHCVLLWVSLQLQYRKLGGLITWKNVMKLGLACVLMALALIIAQETISVLLPDGKASATIELLLIPISGAGVFFMLLRLFRFEAIGMVLVMIFPWRRWKQGKSHEQEKHPQ